MNNNKASIRMEEYDRLRNIERNYKKSIAEIEKCADAKAREEFVSKAVKLAEENGRLRGRIEYLEKELETAVRRAVDAIDAQKRAEHAAEGYLHRIKEAEKRVKEEQVSEGNYFMKFHNLQDEMFRLRSRGLLARIFRRYE